MSMFIKWSMQSIPLKVLSVAKETDIWRIFEIIIFLHGKFNADTGHARVHFLPLVVHEIT